MKKVLQDKFRHILELSIVKFAYVKLDGTYRMAIGTRSMVIAQMEGFENATEHSDERKQNPNAYYDFEKQVEKTEDIHPPKTDISVHFLSNMTKFM